MKRFLNHRDKRTTTALVLITWLFALASGIANACLLQEPRGIHVHAAGIGESPHAHAVAALPGRVTVIESDTNPSPATKALCLDACDDRTNSLPKQTGAQDPPHLAPLAVIATLWLATQSMVSALRLERDDHADPSGVPIRVRYSRLTL